MKNGQVVESNYKYQIEFRNGVCRLTIPQSYQGLRAIIIKYFSNLPIERTILDDAGTYECVAQNPLGANATRAVLMVPGDKRSSRIF